MVKKTHLVQMVARRICVTVDVPCKHCAGTPDDCQLSCDFWDDAAAALRAVRDELGDSDVRVLIDAALLDYGMAV